ncbi:MAG TPA: hypothetical protein VLA99_05935 [Nitrospiraceae bacterium]|nr:hypothetical protein [Nitrospiraceae bacterium]
MIPEQEASVPKWQRAVANALNLILRGYPFPSAPSAPPDPKDGQTYFDTTLGKVRTWAGGVWNNHF